MLAMADSAVEGSAGPGSEPDHTDGSPPDLGCWHICNNDYGTDLDIAQETCVFCKRLYHRACCKEMRHAILPGPDTDEETEADQGDTSVAFRCAYCTPAFMAGYYKGKAEREAQATVAPAAPVAAAGVPEGSFLYEGRVYTTPKWCDHPGCDRAHPNKPFTDTNKLKMHKRKHDMDIPACPGCSEPIKCDKNMKNHIRKCKVKNPDYWDTEDDLVGALMAPTERV